MRFDVVTIFPGMFDSVFDDSIIGKACDKNLIEICLHDLRDFTQDKHKTTDDYPYGGGAGMVMKVAPVYRAVTSIKQKDPSATTILMTPQGKKLDHNLAVELSSGGPYIIVCGRYEGFDERIRELVCDMEISIGDFVMTGGEIPAMALIDAVGRLVPGVVGEKESTQHDSHSDGLLEHPHYTRPPEFMGHKVPDILMGGHHANIEKWRHEKSIEVTRNKRPDLFEKWSRDIEDRDEK